MVSQLLKQERLKRGLTQKALAEKSGISFVAVNRIEKGALPRLSVAIKLFSAMDLDLKLAIEEKSEG